MVSLVVTRDVDEGQWGNGDGFPVGDASLYRWCHTELPPRPCPPRPAVSPGFCCQGWQVTLSHDGIRSQISPGMQLLLGMQDGGGTRDAALPSRVGPGQQGGHTQCFTLVVGSRGSYMVIVAGAPVAVCGAGGTAHPTAPGGVVLVEAPGRCCKVLPNKWLINVGALVLLARCCLFLSLLPKWGFHLPLEVFRPIFWGDLGRREVCGSSSACTRWQQPSSPRSDCAAQPPWPPAPGTASSTACVTF